MINNLSEHRNEFKVPSKLIDEKLKEIFYYLSLNSQDYELIESDDINYSTLIFSRFLNKEKIDFRFLNLNDALGKMKKTLSLATISSLKEEKLIIHSSINGDDIATPVENNVEHIATYTEKEFERAFKNCLSEQNSLFEILLDNCNDPLRHVSIPYCNLKGHIEEYPIWIINKKDMYQFYKLSNDFRNFKNSFLRKKRTVIVYGGSSYEVSDLNYSWDDFISTDSIKDSIKGSIDFWYHNRAWFKQKKIPHKRGILIYGYPGNGKTFLSKIIISQYELRIYQFNFSNPRVDNNDLINAFEEATDNGPSLFLLEDIDRVFETNAEKQTNVTKDCILNCIDGIRELNGLLIIATANNISNLDSAFINRPSRFDMIINIENPSKDLRMKYLQRLFKDENIETSILESVAVDCDGMSMSFMKEIYFKSVVNAMNKKHSNILIEDLSEAVDACLTHFNAATTKKNERNAGFTSNSSRKNDKREVIEN